MAKKLNIDFLGKKKIFFTISAVLILIILVCSFVFGVKLDIQFKGGTIVTYTYEGTIDENEVKKVSEETIGSKVKVDMKDAIQGDNVFDIVLIEDKGLEASKLNSLTDAVSEKFKDNNLKFLSNSSVNPTIGNEFFAKSMVGVGFAAILLVIYIALRFKKISGWSAGVMAVIALVHDVIIVFGVFVIFGIPLDYNFIAVLLTILGYSVNDTIVIYDRIRENNRLYGKKMDRTVLVNTSINETFSRTINTTVTTLIAMITICIVSMVMGVNSIMSFAFPMTIGLVSGTYSTICIASPLWVVWQDYKEKKNAKKPLKASK